MGASVGGNKGFVSEINVTPFVDVMLVLLIIFMVTAPMMTEGLDVDLPQTRAVETLPTESDNMILTVRKDGAIFLDSYEVGLDELPADLREAAVFRRSRTTDRRAPASAARGKRQTHQCLAVISFQSSCTSPWRC